MLSYLPPAELIDALNKAQRPVLAGHTNPDIDALAAMLAVARAIPDDQAMITLADEPVARRLRFMLALAGVDVAKPEHVANADILVVLDTGGTNRVNVPGGWKAIADRFVINIDHHVTNSDFGRINWVVDGASSSSELVYHLIRAAGWPLDGITASLLYAGIHADTCGFSLPTASPETFEAASVLVRAGADIDKVVGRLIRSYHPNEFALLRTVYHNTRLAADGRIAYSVLTADEILAAGCTAADIDDQVAIPRLLSGIQVAVLFSEIERGLVRVNLRGENGTSILPVAVALGGGGHTCSAGVRIRRPMDEAIQIVLDQATRHLDELGPS